MSMWKHNDTKTIALLGLGFGGLFVAAMMVAVAWVRSQPVPTGAWLLAGAGAPLLAWGAVRLHRADKRIGAYQRRRNERASAIRDQVLAGTNPARPYFVYLRPFDIDGKFVEAPREGADHAYVEEYGWPMTYHDLESGLALLVYKYGELVALSDDPGKAGAGYVRSTDISWQDEVCALCQHAEGIFVVPFDREGTAWEVEMLVERGWLDKVFFIMPAASPLRGWPNPQRLSPNYRKLWKAGRVRYKALNLPEYDKQGAMVQVGDGVRVLKVFGGWKLSTADRQRRKRDLETLRSRLEVLSSANKPS
jgi:hypothetical protein